MSMDDNDVQIGDVWEHFGKMYKVVGFQGQWVVTEKIDTKVRWYIKLDSLVIIGVKLESAIKPNHPEELFI